jgi:hypothetical protein
MAMADNLRFLVIDGYNKEAREELVAGGASMAADQYTRMLKGSTPGGAADIDVLFPADPGASLPTGAALAQYDGIAWTGCSLTVFEDDPRLGRADRGGCRRRPVCAKPARPRDGRRPQNRANAGGPRPPAV